MTPTPTQGIRLEVRGLSKSYNGQPVLRELSFTVERGEVFVIMGPSGSGKTVLLKHLIGLELPDAGEILLEGEPVGAPETLTRHRVAMVFQSGALLNSLTVAENVGLYLAEHRLKPPAEIRRIVSAKLALLGLAGTEDRLPAELSGGMKKRVAIARALVIEPQLIFYDEPTSELDPLIAATCGRLCCGHTRDGGVPRGVLPHDRDLAFGIAHRIAVLHAGRFLALGTPDEVRVHPDPVVQQFLHADFAFTAEPNSLPQPVAP